MKALTAQQLPPSSPAPTSSLTPWTESAILIAAIAYLIRIVMPTLFTSWLKRSELETQHDIQSETVTLQTVLATLTKMQDAVLTQQNTLISNLLNRHQTAIEDSQLVTAINSQNKMLETLIINQEKILEFLQKPGLNQEQDSIQK